MMTNANKQIVVSTYPMSELPREVSAPAIREPGSALTHFIAMLFSIAGAFPLLHKALQYSDQRYFISMFIFIFCMILLYAASTCFHSFDVNPGVNTILKKMDHMMISVFIAATYTPICVLVLPKSTGLTLLIVVWSIAVLEIILKAFFVFCPKWVSSILYIGMGWSCIIAFPTLYHSLSAAAFDWILAGGIIYTIGGVIYALKLPVLEKLPKNFGIHEIFHLFVMGGSLCHFIAMYSYIL